MTSNINKNKELLNRLMILEKFIELKSNECAYYRSKVHLMQMNSFNYSQIIRKKSSIKQDYKHNKRSSSEDLSHSSITSQNHSTNIDNRYRRNSVPLLLQQKTNLKKNLNISHMSNTLIPFDQSIKSKHLTRRHRRKFHDKTYAKNQNYYEDVISHSNQKLVNPNSSLLTKDKNLIDQILISYINKQVQQTVSAHAKNIQCNDNDFHPIELSSKSSPIVLIIRLPDRFIKILLEKQKKNLKTPKLKVHISSELLNKLFQSNHFNSIIPHKNQFTIESQYGTIAACIHQDNSNDIEKSKIVHVKAEVKNHHEHRLPIVRHLVRTRSNGSERKKIIAEKNLHTMAQKHRIYRRKKKNLHKSYSTSPEETYSRRTSSTNEPQSIETLLSSDQTSNSISVKNNQIKKNKRN
ncbi:unnamed protein product [Rotaria sordida]|uniref:Uncharacterized protein n=1 Tax=Rotaria sordida TaxID=392033 RepID=A0A813TRJ9_9BILA|nr:unnamed protein product [Rotaria sordida]CAF3563617.1 unnamed protein product [Rotaria sordida]